MPRRRQVTAVAAPGIPTAPDRTPPPPAPARTAAPPRKTPPGTGDAVKIGITLPQFRDEADTALEAARRAEELGFDGVFCFDHLWPMGRPDRPALSSAPLLGALAAIHLLHLGGHAWWPGWAWFPTTSWWPPSSLSAISGAG